MIRNFGGNRHFKMLHVLLQVAMYTYNGVTPTTLDPND